MALQPGEVKTEHIALISLIIIALLSLCLNVYLVLENRRITEKMEGYADALGELESIQ